MVDKGVWNINDVKTFDFNITEEERNTPYNFYLLVRNNKDYPYRNLHLQVDLVLPNGDIARSNVPCDLANYEGKWLGEGMGGEYNSEILFKTNQVFPEEGDYQIKIAQYMRENDIKGIEAVGISIRSIQ